MIFNGDRTKLTWFISCVNSIESKRWTKFLDV